MLTFFYRRLAGMVPTLLIVSIIVFLFLHLIPGDPAQLLAGQDASVEDIENTRIKLGLDKPLYEQYWHFVTGMIKGELGESFRTQEPVLSMIAERILPTLHLTFFSMVWAIVLGLLFGVISATRRGKWQDTTTMVLAVAGISMPSFWLGMMLIDLFAVKLGWLPSAGNRTFFHVILPAITLGSGIAAVIARFTRTSLLETLREDYVRTARAKGAREWRVVWLHALRNALIPIVTMTGMQFGLLLGGSIVVETVFSWPGIGRLLIDSLLSRDYPVIRAEILLFVFQFMVINLLVDVTYALINPQIRLRN